MPPVNFYTEVRDLNKQELENVVVAAPLGLPAPDDYNGEWEWYKL